LCVPSYLAFEPEGPEEPMGHFFLGAASLGMLAWLLSSMRAVRALAGSFRFARECRQAGRMLRICARNEALVVESPRALLGLSGVVAPRVLISSAVLGALSPDELDVALCHEQAHRSARDNFKRLLILLAPDVLPFRRLLAGLGDGWASFAEWAADDEASRGNPQRALALAGALVRIARIGSGPEVPLVASFTAGGRHLEARVERLLHLESPGNAAALTDSGAAQFRAIAGLAAAASGCLAPVVFFLPAALSLIYRLLEAFVH
jgi:hypothetical protein